MVLLKRKPILLTPLPSLTTVLQPLTDNLPGPSSPSHPSSSALPDTTSENGVSSGVPIPPDAETDDEQMEILSQIFRGEYAGAQGHVGQGKGKKAGTRLIDPLTGFPVALPGPPTSTGPSGKEANGHGSGGRKGSSGASESVNGVISTQELNGLVQNLAQGMENGEANGHANGEGGEQAPQPVEEEAPVHWRIWDRECYYLPETGEIFTDYESYLARVTFYQQPLYSCETSGKNSLSYYRAHQSELRETRHLHTKFPKQLKVPVLKAVQFQIEGKMEKLVDTIFERFHNRFFDDERVFVDVEGDKYLARVVKTFPPKSLAASSSDELQPHHYASDLNMTAEEMNEVDDPLKYIYHVRLIEKGSADDLPADYAAKASSSGSSDGNGETWGGSTMEIQADKIGRERSQFSRVMLKRFFKDCLVRDTAVYSPWLLKPPVAVRYGLPTEMSEEVKSRIQTYKERQMDRRKREREERLGLNQTPEPEVVVEEKPTKSKKQKKEPVEEEVKEEEVPKVKKIPIKYPIDDLLLEWSEDVDGAAGRPKVRPALVRSLPFGDHFEKFLMSWSFLNAMGKALNLSSFTIDDYEQALYHNDPWTSPTPIMTEIHATLINALIRDLAAGHEPVRSISLTGATVENDTDYWEGSKGATADTLRPAVEPLGNNWFMKYLKAQDGRKGWESALVGCLWDRATLDTLPRYLDNILHLTFEDKPAPTRPTWSTGPTQATGPANGLIPSKPEKRYSTLHHLHKLDIITFLIELVAQTEHLREFMEEEVTQLTESRKEQVEVKREWKRVKAEIEDLTPKEDGPPAETALPDSELPKSERAASVDISLNGRANGNVTRSNTERDELDSSPAPMDEDLSDIDDNADEGLNATAASRRRAMKEKAAEREAEEATRLARVTEEKARNKETKLQAAEKKRLMDEFAALTVKLRHIDYDLRAHLYALRARPLGLDRFGNRIWWFDGLGSGSLINEKGSLTWGTGRIFVQGVEEVVDLELIRLAASETNPPNMADVQKRRAEEEGGKLASGEWGAYDSPDSLADFMKWLNPRGQRELALIKSLKSWLPEIEGGMRKRRIGLGLEESAEGEEPVKKMRPVRKVVAAGGLAGDDEGGGYMVWKNRRARDK